MIDYFVFPVNFNDVEQEPASLNKHQVFLIDLALSDKEILRRLKTIDSNIFNNFESIAQPENFDFLYSLIKHFAQNIEAKSMKVLEELASTLQYITQHILKTIQEFDEGNLGKMRVPFKMVMFLALFFISSTSLKKAKSGQGDILAEAMNKEKGKRRNKNENFELSKNVIDHQKFIIKLIRDTLNLNFVSLWEKKQVDTEFFKKYTDVCVKILQSSMVKDEDIIQSIFYILEAILNANQNQSVYSSFQTVLANLVYEGDSVDNLVQFFSKQKGPELQKLCTQALTLVVIFLINKQNLNSQSQSIKNTKDFLSKLSEKTPKIFYTNLSCFIILFKHDSYYLRNAIGDILMNILRYVLVGESEQTYKEAKQKFISTLLQRIYDKSSFCRSHTLGILAQLTIDKVVPRKYLILFMKAGIDRIKDQSINTRKKAIQLINAVIDELCMKQMVTTNQIQKELELSELELKTLCEEEDRLKKEMDQVDDEDKLQELVTQIKIIKKRIKNTEEKEMSLFEMKQINNLLQKVIDNVKILLGSKNQSDVLETIRMFIKLYKLNFAKAKDTLPNIRILIFSKEKKIKDEVLTNFIYLHLNNKSEEVAKQLINLFTSASPQDLSALEQIIETIVAQSLAKEIVIIRPQAYAHMWNQFISFERNQTNVAQKRAIITILRIAFSKNNSLIREENMESFLNILKSYVESNDPDFHILKEISKIICLDDVNVSKVAKNFLIAQIYILVNTQGTTNNEWFSACQSILTCIFKVCENPQKLSELMIKKLHEKLDKEKTVKGLSQFIFALSHSCLKCLIYLDSVQNKIKAIKQRDMMEENEEVELDKVMGGKQAQLEKKIQEIQILSQKILDDPFISRWINIIEKIVTNFTTGNELEIICVLAYCKFMCLSSSFCQRKFQLILRILNNNNINSVVKNNIIIAIGDLLHRFPNIVQPYNKHLYQNLHEKDARVRKTTLTVITHLSLNDMIKVKSDMCDVALLFQDSDPEIESLVKQFFHEMNKKDPKTLFNLIPDALSRFSNLEKMGSESTFRVFLENILPLLEKDKYSQSLVIKLCERLANSLNMLQISNTAFCLSQININQKGLRRIIQNFESFRKTLSNNDVALAFKNIITKLKKSQKNQLKNLIEELQEKVNNSNEEIFNVDEIRKRNTDRLNKKQPKKRNFSNSQSNKKSGKRRQEVEDMEQQAALTRTRPARQRKMRVIEQSEQADGGEEDDQYEFSQ